MSFFTSAKTVLGLYFPLILFGCLGFFGYLMPSVDWFRATPGDLADGRFNSVILEHLFGWLSGRWADLWSPGFFYPNQGALAFSDNHFGSAFPYILLRWLGFIREEAFSGWYVIGCSLNFFVSYIVLRKLHFSIFAASAGAFVFSFSLPALAQSGHAQLTYRFAIPLAFYEFWNVVNKRKINALGFLAFWVCVQFYCSIYLGMFLIFLLIASIIASMPLLKNSFTRGLIQSWAGLKKSSKISFISLMNASAIALFYLLQKYQEVASNFGFEGSKWEAQQMLPRLESYLVADQSPLSSFVGSWFKEIPYRSEHQLFFGIGVSIFFFVGCIVPWFKFFNRNRPYANDQNAIGKVAIFTFLILFLLTLKFGVGGGRLASIYEYFFAIPGILSIRAVTRMVLVLGLPVAIIVALGCDGLLNRIRQTSHLKQLFLSIFIAILLSIEVIFFIKYSAPYETWVKRKSDLTALLPSTIPLKSILFINHHGSGPWYMTEVDAMVIAQDMGIPTINGYSGKFPPGHHHTTLSSCIPYMSRLNAYGKFNSLSEEQTNSFAKNVIEIMPSCFKNYKIADFSLGTLIYNANNPDCKQTLLHGKPIPGVFLKKIEQTDGTFLQGIACHGVSITINPITGL